MRIAGDRDIECDYEDWYPLVGVDSPNAVHINFGQEPFRYDDVVGECIAECLSASTFVLRDELMVWRFRSDELFAECQNATNLVANELQWYSISDSECGSGAALASSEDDAEGDFDDEPRLYLW